MYQMDEGKNMAQARRPQMQTARRQAPAAEEKAAERSIFEATGDEQFFLVEYWSRADPPMVVLHQLPISESV